MVIDIKILIISLLVGFIVSLALAPFIIKACTKLKASQTILHYVKEHSGKEGTPTMGGFIFILGIVSSFFFFKSNYTLAIITLVTMIAYGTLGFLDDFIKIRYKQNMGLRAYQKMIGQVGIAVLIAIFVWTSNLVPSTVFLPFTSMEIELGWVIIPFIIFFFLAVTNSVNLTDGLDGLAGGVSIAYILGYIAIFIVTIGAEVGMSGAITEEMNNLLLVAFSSVGALLAYMLFNGFPAKIFMGDTGSLALGGLIACLAIFARQELVLPFIGFMFVMSCVSVIMQVVYFKKTRKRIFLMAPLHHHFQKKRVHENRIVFVYIVVTVVISLLTTVITLYARG